MPCSVCSKWSCARRASAPRPSARCRSAHHAARDLLGMIDDLLDVAKIEAERLVLAPAPLEIDAWIAGVAAIYEPAARAKGARARRQAARRCGPRLDCSPMASACGRSSAICCRTRSSSPISARSRSNTQVAPAQDGKRAVTLTVSDTGIGIAPEKQAMLFTPFVQAHDGRARNLGGTGLGLTISKRLVTMMGGTIELSSEPGRGTRFTVRIDFPEAEAMASTADAPSAPAGALAGSLAGLRVLVVDDHPANRIVLEGQIRLLGGVAQIAVDGRERTRTLARRTAARIRRDSHRLFDARNERRGTGAHDPGGRGERGIGATRRADRRPDGERATRRGDARDRVGHDGVSREAARSRRSARCARSTSTRDGRAPAASTRRAPASAAGRIRQAPFRPRGACRFRRSGRHARRHVEVRQCAGSRRRARRLRRLRPRRACAISRIA